MIGELRRPIVLERSPETAVPLQDGVRDETFDVLKGIAIILMIVGHCEIGPLRPFIFSFHMPLFFFVAGYFLKVRSLRDEFRLSVRRLILPYAFTALCICIIAVCEDLLNYSWSDGSYTQGTIIHFLLGFRGDSPPEWLFGHVGMLWFILAMFWARFLAVLFIGKIKSQRILCSVFFFFGLLGIVLERNYFIPYCIPQGFSAAGFIYVGYLVKKLNLLDSANNIKRVLPFLVILWLYCWSQGVLGLYICRFPAGYVFSVLGALGAFFVLFIVVKNTFYKENFFWKCIQYCGRCSLVIYCVHAIEFETCNWKAFALLHHIPLAHFTFFQISVHLTIAIVFTLIILKIRPLREGIFQISKI
ncbi:MAG: acyltransferase family protein [Fibrobacter sp.]|nr:acyltransferase family protein [Fibrobacter sp.]